MADLIANLPYGFSRAIWAGLGIPSVQRRQLRRLRLKYDLHPFLRNPEPHPHALRRYIHHVYYQDWREDALDRLSDRSFARWTSFVGSEHLAAARVQGQGVILVGAHYGASQTLKIVLSRLGLDLVSVGFVRRGRPRGPWQHADVRWVRTQAGDAELLRLLVGLRTMLRGGGAVHLAADGPVGRSGVCIDFLGKPRRFGLGFAALASTTRAPVVPVFAELLPGGQLQVEYLPPLAPPDRSLGRELRLEALVREYAGVLEAKCLRDPALIMPGGPVPLRSEQRVREHDSGRRPL